MRNDIKRFVISKQLALALSDEIKDLQNAGIKIIQVDEAAFKEGYPLRKEHVSDYENGLSMLLNWLYLQLTKKPDPYPYVL